MFNILDLPHVHILTDECFALSDRVGKCVGLRPTRVMGRIPQGNKFLRWWDMV